MPCWGYPCYDATPGETHPTTTRSGDSFPAGKLVRVSPPAKSWPVHHGYDRESLAAANLWIGPTCSSEIVNSASGTSAPLVAIYPLRSWGLEAYFLGMGNGWTSTIRRQPESRSGIYQWADTSRLAPGPGKERVSKHINHHQQLPYGAHAPTASN